MAENVNTCSVTLFRSGHDAVGRHGVTGVGEARERLTRVDFARHRNGIELAADFKAFVCFDVYDLVRRRRRHVNAGTDERHEQEFLNRRRIEIQRNT